MKGVWITALCLWLLGSVSLAQSPVTDADIERKIDSLLSRMTLEEKVGQMTQITLQVVSATRGTATQPHRLDLQKLRKAIVEYHVGSILNVYDVAFSLDYWNELITRIQDIALHQTRLGIPVIYGIDAIHGANYLREGTLFPQSIALAATRNPELVRKSARITAREIRAAGIPWNFNPVLGVGRTPLWPRFFETFGEDPYLVSVMGEAYVQGMQGTPSPTVAPDRAAACMKHYLGYSFPLSGKDRTPAWIPERMLREIFLPPFRKAVETGVLTVMVNSSEINGIPSHSDPYLLTQILRKELGFDGFVVSDWEDVNRLFSRDRVAASRKEAVKMAVMAGVDMSMVPYDFSFYEDLLALVQEGEVPVSRIDQAVRRILRVKFRLNLFEHPYPNRNLRREVGSGEHAAVSLQAAREALTLLKNEKDFLPLSKDQTVLVTGPTANLRSALNGGWTYTWQGNEESLYPPSQKTILEAIQAKLGRDRVKHVPGSDFDNPIDIPAAVEAARKVDVAIVCLGEPAYCETPGNIHDLTLPQAQLDLVKAIQETGTPVVLVLVEGRPRIITPVVEKSRAILMAYLPGPRGGQAIAEALFGDINPSGKLPFTYPRYPNDLVCYDYKPIQADDPNKVAYLYPFGHGLSYTRFEYHALTVEPAAIFPEEPVQVSVTVENTGARAGKAVVELYVSDLYRTVSPPVKQLKRFTGVYLEPGESRRVNFTLTAEDLAFWGREGKFVTEPGTFRITVGDQSTTFELLPEAKRARK